MMGLTGDALSDAAWAKLAPHLPGKAGDVGCTAADNRLFLNAGLWVLRHGGTWRVLPARFGSCGVYPAHRRLRPAARLFVDGLMEQPRRGPGPPSQAMSQEVFQPLSLQVEGHLDSHRLCARGFDTAAYSHARDSYSKICPVLGHV